MPPNLEFVTDDVEDVWLNGDNFDLVHMRNMTPILPKVDNVLHMAFE